MSSPAISIAISYDGWTLPAVKADTWAKNQCAQKIMRAKRSATKCRMCSFCLSRQCSDNPVRGTKALKKTKRPLLRHTKTFDHTGTNPDFLHVRNGERMMDDRSA
jgi:hypothetical protein